MKKRDEANHQLKRDLVAGIAHDLRTPIATITTAAELLEQEIDSEESTHLMSVIQRQVQHLEGMVRDLVEYAGLQSGKVVLHPGTVDLVRLVQEVCQDFQEVNSSHTLVMHLPASLVRISADEDKLRRILENLLRNAFNYSPEGTQVVASARRLENGNIRLQVEDQGPGVSESDRLRIFEPFVRLRAAVCSGQGLGLHLVKLFIDAHQGAVWVEDGDEGGARFCIELPHKAGRRLASGGSFPRQV